MSIADITANLRKPQLVRFCPELVAQIVSPGRHDEYGRRLVAKPRSRCGGWCRFGISAE